MYNNRLVSRQKKSYPATLKAQVVLELSRGDKTLNELAEQYQIAPAPLSTWHRVFQERAQTVFQQGPTTQDKEISRQNEVSVSLDKSFVMRCLNRALSRRCPEVMNSDQGSRFTNEEYLNLLKSCGVQVFMDGKGRALDNVRTERFFRSLKYEDVYIKDYEDARSLRLGVGAYIADY